jgi:hypothetical protein
MRTLSAIRLLIQPGFKWFAQHEMEETKVLRLQAHLHRGGRVPPVVLVDYKGSYMPLDGHHRTDAHERTGRSLDAWVVKGQRFEDFCNRLRADGISDPECQVMCGGVPAPLVAERWSADVEC